MSAIYYIKISKKDSTGNDNTGVLQQLTNLRVIYSNPLFNTNNYVITNISEYPTYFLYQISPSTTFYTPDTEIKNFTVSASNPTGFGIPPNSFFSFISASYTNILTDTLGYLTGSSGIYQLHTTPNIPLNYTFSARITSNTTGSVSPLIFLNNEGKPFVNACSASLITGPVILTLSGSFTPIENEKYSFILSETNGVSSYSASNVFLRITQSIDPQNGTPDMLVFTPNFTSKFEGSDYDVLYGDVDGLVKSKYFFKIDYTNYKINPSEFQLILSGSASKSEVKDYNYYLKRYTQPRYQGSRSTSQDFNITSSNGTLGFDPNVERTTPFFLYFTQMVDDSPLIKDVTSPLIKYLIDENGNVYSPSTTDNTYFDLVGSFEVGKNAYSKLLSSTTNVFNKNQPIKLSGEFYKPILYSLSSSFLNTATFTTIIDFLNLQGTSTTGAPDYGFYRESLFGSSLILDSGSNLTYLQNGVLNPFYDGIGSAGYDLQTGYVTGIPSTNLSDPHYTFNGTPQTSVTITCHIGASMVNNIYYNGTSPTIQLQIWMIRGGTPTLLNALPINNLTVSATQQYTASATYYPQTNDKVYFNVKYLGGVSPVRINNPVVNDSNYNSWLKITTNGLSTPSITSPYFWTTGSANSNVLTSSQALGLALQGNYIQKDIDGSGFPHIEDPAQIFPGDEIRFEYDEANTYIIKDIQSFNNSSVCLFLDRIIPSVSSSNIDHFTIRRKFKNTTTGVTLNAKLTNNITDGFLFPQYPTQKLKDNLSNIIKTLQEKGLI